jgi:hypothetical protein
VSVGSETGWVGVDFSEAHAVVRLLIFNRCTKAGVRASP